MAEVNLANLRSIRQGYTNRERENLDLVNRNQNLFIGLPNDRERMIDFIASADKQCRYNRELTDEITNMLKNVSFRDDDKEQEYSTMVSRLCDMNSDLMEKADSLYMQLQRSGELLDSEKVTLEDCTIIDVSNKF